MTHVLPIKILFLKESENIKYYISQVKATNVPSEKDYEELTLILQKIEMIEIIDNECDNMIERVLNSNLDNILLKMNINTINQRRYSQSHINSIYHNYIILLQRMIAEDKDITNYIIDIFQ